jgi:hypothetical protein
MQMIITFRLTARESGLGMQEPGSGVFPVVDIKYQTAQSAKHPARGPRANTVEIALRASHDKSWVPLVSLPASAEVIPETSTVEPFGTSPALALEDKPTSGTR